MRDSGESIRLALSDGGRCSGSWLEGGDEKRVVSKVILRMSHFRRDDASASFWVAREAGGWMRENADVSKE